MRLAFVYDRLNKIGGAERILTALHNLWPTAPWYTAVYQPKTAPFAQGWPVTPSFMQAIPCAPSHHEWFPWLTPFAFESFSFNEYDVVISITSAEAKGIITKPSTLHLCYCLTPTRYLWSHAREYDQVGDPILKPARQLILDKLRRWDEVAAQRPDHYLAISKTVKRRIKKYYHRNAEVIYPPVDTDFFSPSRHKTTSYQFTPWRSFAGLPAKSYYLIVSRLVPYKRVDLAIQAANDLNLPLVVVGTGSAKARLKHLAGPTIIFTGQISDEVLRFYYHHCRALIFPGEEDFGLTSLEAQSMGKPVIAYCRGGLTETILEGQTGLFFDTLSVSSLTQALKKFETFELNPIAIRRHAISFDVHLFRERFKTTIETLCLKHQQAPK